MKLVIAEKPSLGKAIQAWLTIAAKTQPKYKDYKVTWLFGHMLEMVQPEEYDPKWKSWDISLLPIKPAEFKLCITNNPGIKAQVAKVKALHSECSEIIHAGDPDREGQLLVDELLDSFHNKKPVFRLWLAAIDDKSIEKAFNSIKPNAEYLGYKLAAETRSRADWLVGMNYSRAFSHVFRAKGYQNAISIGRVQTPTLKLIVDRDNEIKYFISKDFYELCGTFSTGSGSFTAKLAVPAHLKSICDGDGRVLDKNVLTAIAAAVNHKSGVVSHYSKETKTKKQPLLFNLSELQAVANKKFGYSAQEVLDIAQILYENKLTSYPRSDCRYLPESQFVDAPAILDAIVKIKQYSGLTPNSSIKSPAWNDKKITAHHAIILTGANLSNLDSLKEPESKVFDLIVRQYLMQFYPELSYDEVDIRIDIESYQFSAQHKLYAKMERENIISAFYTNELDNDQDGGLLPVLHQGQTLDCTKTEVVTKKTQQPKPYTEGTLIKAMENIHTQISDLVKQQGLDEATTLKLINEYKSSLKETSGLGTEATRANIIEILKKRGFVTNAKKNIIGTDLGHLLIDVMTNNKIVRDELGFLTSAITTAQYEQFFDEIQNNNARPVDFFKNLYQQLDRLSRFATLPFVVPLNSTSIPCPNCKTGYLNQKNSPRGKFWGCSQYKSGCIATFTDNKGQPVLTTATKAQTTNEKCPKCKSGAMVIRSGKNGKFKACNKYPECKFIDNVTD